MGPVGPMGLHLELNAVSGPIIVKLKQLLPTCDLNTGLSDDGQPIL